MMQNLKFKPKAGYVYVVTSECLKLVKAKGIFRGKMGGFVHNCGSV